VVTGAAIIVVERLELIAVESPALYGATPVKVGLPKEIVTHSAVIGQLQTIVDRALISPDRTFRSND
jgi:hypothetical protein